MAETKLTPEQVAEQLSDDVITALHEASYEAGEIDSDSQEKITALCTTAINEYAAQQQAEHERVLAVLREHEWGHDFEHEPKFCPACLLEETKGHFEDCWLAALLRQGEGE